MRVFGIDISVWQKGLNISSLKDEGVEFIIIRGAHTASNKTKNKDSEFEKHYAVAKQNNIPVGSYYYSRATTYEEGKEEALYFYNNCLKGKQFEYPVYIDVEDSLYQMPAGKAAVTNAIKGFCETLESVGYYVGVYCNLNWLNNYMNYEELRKKYDYWIALWNNSEPNRSKYSYGMWQFGGETNLIRSNKILGYTCDQNYAFKDYPMIMKNHGLNGFVKQPPIVIDEKPTIEEKIEEKPKGDEEITILPKDQNNDLEEPKKFQKRNIFLIIINFIIKLFIRKKTDNKQ